MQHHDVVKVGRIFGMMDKIDTRELLERLQKLLLIFLRYKPKISLQACKINDGSYNKAANDLKFKVLSRNKPKNIAVHVETIGLQQDSFRRLLRIMLPKVDKHLYGI